MPYYGDYYRGDYYRGDPGLFGFLGRAVKGVAKAAIGTFVGATPVGQAVRAVQGAVRGRVGAVQVPPTIIPPSMPPVLRAAAAQRGTLEVPGMTADTYGFKKRRRMNVANPKALRRAIRRESGFVKLARRALKGTGYSVVSRASQRKRYSVKEAGPGGVTIQ